MIRDELLAFGITGSHCIDKMKEHAENCADIRISILECKVNQTDCNQYDVTVYHIAIESLEGKLKYEQSQLRKWKSYLAILNGNIPSSNAITGNDIESARSHDIVSLISETIQVKKTGSTYMAKCPFHNEDTPSFMIKNNSYYCFGCGEHGDAIDWMVKTRGMSFKEAVKSLC